MTATRFTKEPLPPYLPINDYADFIEESIKNHDPIKVARQKAIEKKITKAFCINPANKGKS